MSYNFQTHESQCKNEMNAEECLDLRKHIISEAENIEIVKKELSYQNVPDPATLPMQGMPTEGMPMQGISVQGMTMQGMPMQGMPMQGMPMQGVAMTTSMEQVPLQPFDVMPLLAKLTPVDSYRTMNSPSMMPMPFSPPSLMSTPFASMLPLTPLPLESLYIN